MAAAIIPLASIIASAAPLLLPLINSLILHVEAVFGAKTGPAKLAAVVGAVGAVANELSAAGRITGIVDPIAIATMTETEVQRLKAAGALTPAAAAATLGQVGPPSLPSGRAMQVMGTLTFT